MLQARGLAGARSRALRKAARALRSVSFRCAASFVVARAASIRRSPASDQVAPSSSQGAAFCQWTTKRSSSTSGTCGTLAPGRPSVSMSVWSSAISANPPIVCGTER